MTSCPTIPTVENCNVWKYSDFDTWKDEILHLMSDLINQDLITAFLQSDLDEMSQEDFSWLNALVSMTTGKNVDIPTTLNHRLRGFYKSIRAYHGTRTDNIDSFYTNGLLTLNIDNVKIRAREIFLTDRFPELTQSHLESAFSAADFMVGARLGVVCFFLSRDECLDAAGSTAHYTKYGCEYLQAIAANIPTTDVPSNHYVQSLVEHGESAIVVCNVPISLIPEHSFSQLVKQSLYDVFTSYLNPREYNYKRGVGVLCIRNQLPAECIVGHEFLTT